MSELRFSWLDIVGEPDVHSTPWIVWQEIAECHGIIVSDQDRQAVYRILRSVQSSPVVVSNPPKDHEWGRVVRFVNRNESWGSVEQLLKALSHLYSPPPVSSLLTRSSAPVISECTTGNPTATNLLLAYKYCRDLKVPLEVHTTRKEIEYALKVWSQPSSVITKLIQLATKFASADTTRDLIKEGILKFIYTVDSAIAVPSYNELKLAHEELEQRFDKSTYEHEGTLKSIGQLVCYAARHFRVNILKHTNLGILLSFAILSGGRWDYPRELCFSIDPNLPPIYTTAQLADLAISLGSEVTNASLPVLYTQVSNHLIGEHTFYPITHINDPDPLMDETLIFARRVAMLNPQEVLSWGTINRSICVMTYEEVAETLESNGTFRDFIPKEGKKAPSDFPQHVISRLRYLANENSHLEGARRLNLVISYVEQCKMNDLPVWESLKNIYNKSDKLTRERIREYIGKLLDLGMYMRGWKGKGDYILGDIKLNDSERKARDQNVNIMLVDVLNADSKHAYQDQILNVPLYRYSGGKYIKPTAQDAARTLRERLVLVSQGEMVGTDSCVRMSSNWVVGTCVYAMQFLDIQPPFNIAKLEYIS